MFIELTDHLRCPEDHEEAYLVLLPDSSGAALRQSGELGCPVCHRTFHIRDGILDIGDGPPSSTGEPTLDGASVAALTGLGGPGGYLVLVGPIAARWREMEDALNGVSLVSVNGPADLADTRGLSIVRSAAFRSRRRRCVAWC
jgi:uncharacterized protein YbaR (Trm112 family)